MGISSNVSPVNTNVDARTTIDSHNVTNVSMDGGQYNRMSNCFDNTLPKCPGCDQAGGQPPHGVQQLLQKVIPLLKQLLTQLGGGAGYNPFGNSNPFSNTYGPGGISPYSSGGRSPLSGLF